ncbi:MAG TPA: S9 family peptidase, partial [Bacteroidia bacterium]|nr:S9 family peptidase [Bacteroidia bacterium]
MKKIILSFLVLAFAVVHAQQLAYPKTKKDAQVDDYFGTKVADPYRWLEDDNSPETKAWVDEENKVTFDYLSKIPFRGKIKTRLTQVWNFEKLSVPYKKSGMYFSFYNNGLQNQSILFMQKKLTEPRMELLDPNKLSAEGTASLSGWAVSKDGKLMAYGISHAGSDWVEIHVMEIATKKVLEDKVEWVKFSGISWYKNGFYYSRYDTPAEGKALTTKNTGHKVYYHVVGTQQSADKLIFSDTEHPDRNFGADVTEDEDYLILTGSESTSGNSLWIKKTSDESNNWQKYVNGFDSDFRVIGNDGDNFYVLTNNKASNQRLLKMTYGKTEESSWSVLIGEQKDLMETVEMCSDKFLVKYLHDATTQMFVYDKACKQSSLVKLTGVCKVDGLNATKEDTVAFYACYTFTAPPVIYSYNIKTNKSEFFFKPKIDFESDDYETKQVFYTSKDGTKVPMFVTGKKGFKLDGNNPCFVYAYGGFNISLTPSFRTA